jgi:hypothetical protein
MYSIGSELGLTNVVQIRALPVASEIDFWSRQLSEHALFLHLGLEDAKLKQEALAQHKAWEAFRKSVRAHDVPAVLALTASLRAFKTDVLDRMNKGEWLGWLFPLFIDHIRRELDMFVAHLRNEPLPAGELCEWQRFMMEHAAFAGHLLDPVESRLILDARKHVGTFAALQSGCGATTSSMLALSHRAGRELDAYFTQSGIGTPKVKSVIHPVLAAHVVREGQRFLQTVQTLSRG